MNQKFQSQSEQERQAASKIAKLLALRSRKSIHVALFSETHKELRKNLLDKELSIQEVFEKFAQLVNVQDKRAIKILEELVQEKRESILNRLSRSKIDNRSIEDLYAAIESENLYNEEGGGDGGD
jgi:hypothetical protein